VRAKILTKHHNAAALPRQLLLEIVKFLIGHNWFFVIIERLAHAENHLTCQWIKSFEYPFVAVSILRACKRIFLHTKENLVKQMQSVVQGLVAPNELEGNELKEQMQSVVQGLVAPNELEGNELKEQMQL
jgi:hypothetical protein